MIGKKSIGKTNKNKGSNAERHYAKIFRENLGYQYCKTARFGSKLHDNSGIDLIGIPFNVQIKAGKQAGLNISKELLYIKNQVNSNFPEGSLERDNVKILIHKKEVGMGKKRGEFDEIVSMTFEDFTKLIKKIKND